MPTDTRKCSPVPRGRQGRGPQRFEGRKEDATRGPSNTRVRTTGPLINGEAHRPPTDRRRLAKSRPQTLRCRVGRRTRHDPFRSTEVGTANSPVWHGTPEKRRRLRCLARPRTGSRTALVRQGLAVCRLAGLAVGWSGGWLVGRSPGRAEPGIAFGRCGGAADRWSAGWPVARKDGGRAQARRRGTQVTPPAAAQTAAPEPPPPPPSPGPAGSGGRGAPHAPAPNSPRPGPSRPV